MNNRGVVKPFQAAHGKIPGDSSRFPDESRMLRRGSLRLTRVQGIIYTYPPLISNIKGPIGAGPYISTIGKLTIPTFDYIGYRGILPLSMHPKYTKPKPWETGGE